MTSGLEELDLDLFERVISRDRQAFTVFLRRYQQRVFNFCYSYFYDADKAEENTQQAFVKLYKSVHKVREATKLEGYMFQIARNLCIDQMRKNKRWRLVSHLPKQDDGTETIHNHLRPNENTPERILIAREEREKREQLRTLVNDKMRELPPEQRAAIDLVHFKRLPYKKASEILDCPEGTVKSRVNRGIIHLGKLLKNRPTN